MQIIMRLHNGSIEIDHTDQEWMYLPEKDLDDHVGIDDLSEVFYFFDRKQLRVPRDKQF